MFLGKTLFLNNFLYDNDLWTIDKTKYRPEISGKVDMLKDKHNILVAGKSKQVSKEKLTRKRN